MRTQKCERRFLSIAIPAAVVAVGVLASAAQHHTAPKFYPDDPLAREPDTRDASDVRAWDINQTADRLINSFSRPGDPRPNVRAQNLNTIDEVPDSSWFTNRIYATVVTADALRRGPNATAGPAPGGWSVIRATGVGDAPGLTARDSYGDVWFLTFDHVSSPQAATGALAVARRLFWAFGYNQIESHLTRVHADDLDIADTPTTLPGYEASGELTRRDVEQVLARAARDPDGSYRVLAARAAPGRAVGGFKYHGTRPDDPNDIVPHEHRRELRALKVFGAWTNLVNVEAAGTLDTVIEENGRGAVRHYLQDVGSTFGTGAHGARDWDEGYEYVYDGGKLLKRLVTLGFYIQPWQVVRYEELPEIGRFEGHAFEPERWRTRVPAAAVLRARDDDTFWAALRVSAFTDEMIRTAVRAAEYSNPAAERLLGDVLIERRDKIVRAYLPKINPLVHVALGRDGTLTFENAAVRAGVAAAPAGGYRAEWYRFDNATGRVTPLGPPTTGQLERLPAPPQVVSDPPNVIRVDMSALGPPHASWIVPLHAYFRRTQAGWTLVGLERLPDGAGSRQ
ncbi:MAG: hypothetical protein ACRD3C_04380 [Vicinamibacterales bacterium]